MWVANATLTVHRCLVRESEVYLTYLRECIIDRILS